MNRPQLRILCFGDSLTCGYSDAGLQPYSQRVCAMLRTALPAVAVEVVDDGVAGDCVTGPGFRRRLRQAFDGAASPFNWVIILGGTNDLAYAHEAADIFDALESCYNLVIARGGRVLALTVPECSAKLAWIDETRKSLNESILAHRQKTCDFALDLFSKIPFHSLQQSDKEKFWDDDGLHLTPDGYDWMGGHVADGLLRIIKPSEPSRARRLTSDDNRVFDEEDGSPDEISRGYVVVRRKDLD
ncbi:hypothetical protein L249_3498 [Ophiocordyceps polyrhachis-furcata BCC 54312]|uniref:SGNH hydrolase-type esterase domain-containing protein n=1 Tax=Ophiocordyceps polyrhachis-furcata BCC 54312 TaxID=1330021 RepID=A0A367LMA3_9HYPO|nr:hypothetical protein L249_3498 [Ophiocordyceps polyrhachis-furcata BCC 54312]